MNYETLKMGGYGAYVWSSYALTLLALFIMAFAARRASGKELSAAVRRVQINSTNNASSNATNGGPSS